MNEKDYTEWSELKATINRGKMTPFFHEREIWFSSLGANIGYEQDGRGATYLRPVIVLRKFNNEVCLVLPLTKNQKTGVHYFSFSYKRDLVSTAILSQLRLIDAKRLEYKDGVISVEKFGLLKQKLTQLIA